jgi:hypothetical protein
MSIADIIVTALMKGGPYAIGLIGWAAWWYERRINRENNDKLIELATAQIQATLKHETALAANTRLMERVIGR